MKKEKTKKIHEKISREELLGFGSDVFSLNQAEYVSKKIIDEILFHTFETIRIHNVKQMDIDYSVYRNFINLQMIVNLGLIKSEKETELIKKNDFIFDVNPCKIDAWASGRAKIITSTQPKEQIAPSAPRPDKNSESSKIKKKERDKDKIENGTYYKGRKNMETKKVPKEPPPKELPLDFIRPIEEKKESKTFNYDEMKLKGYRAYFQEKQIETLKRKQLEKEQAERAKEEEKKLKQVKDLMNAGKLVSWDATGTFLPIKYVKESDLKNPPQPRQKILDTKTVYDQDKIFDLDEEGKPKKKKILEISKDKIPTIPKTENYYQPNPLLSHNIPQGVVLEFYGHKKSGGKYEVGGGRLTMDQYHQLLDQIKPYENAQIEERADESYEGEEQEKKERKEEGGGQEGEKKEKKEKTAGTKKKGIQGAKKLYFLFKDEIKAVEEHKKQKKNQENIIKKKKKLEEKKGKAQIDKIELKNFNFKEIKNTQDKTIYNELKEKLDEGYPDFYNEKKIFLRMPKEIHMKDEMNQRTRERRSVQDASTTFNQFLPNTIKRTLTKIKEENDLNEEIRKTKTILPPINSRPKSGYITNRNKSKKIEAEKDKK